MIALSPPTASRARHLSLCYSGKQGTPELNTYILFALVFITLSSFYNRLFSFTELFLFFETHLLAQTISRRSTADQSSFLSTTSLDNASHRGDSRGPWLENDESFESSGAQRYRSQAWNGPGAGREDPTRDEETPVRLHTRHRHCSSYMLMISP